MSFDLEYFRISVHALPFFITGVFLLFLALYGLSRDPGVSLHRWFFAVAVSAAGWMMAEGLLLSSDLALMAAFWQRVVLVFAFMFVFTMFGFVGRFSEWFQSTILGVIFALSAFMMAIVWDSSFFIEITRVETGFILVGNEFSRYIMLFLFVIFILSVLILAFARKQFHESVKKTQVTVIIVSYGIAMTALLDWTLVFKMNEWRISFISLFVWSLLLLIGILKFDLFPRNKKLALDAIVQSIPDALLVFDEDGHVLEINDEARRLLGYHDTSLKALHAKDFLPAIHMMLVDAQKPDALLRGVMAHYETVMRPYSGGFVPVECSITVLTDAIGRVRAAIVLCRDIREQQQEAELRNKFIQIVSHQLRTPLNAVRWNLESLQTGDVGKLSKSQKDFIGATHSASVEVINRINDMVTVLDIQQNKVRFTPETVSVESVYDDVLRDVQPLCDMRDVVCKLKPSKKRIPKIRADRARLHDALYKVMKNAVQYTQASGTVSTSLVIKNHMIVITIKDTGVGIPKDEQPRVFEAFFRASNAHMLLPDASGLGLTIAKHFIEEHGGDIRFTSKQDRGSVFTITIPIA